MSCSHLERMPCCVPTSRLLLWLLASPASPAAMRAICPSLSMPNWQETIEGTHYSVDMLLGVAVTALVWHWRSGTYPTSAVSGTACDAAAARCGSGAHRY